MDNVIHAINDDLSRNQRDKSEQPDSLEEMSFVRSCFVDTPKDDFEMPSDDVPPDKALVRSLYHIKIRTMTLMRSPRKHSTADPTDAYTGEEMQWTKDKDGIWDMPDDAITNTILEDDPIDAYERTARLDDLIMRVTNAPTDIQHSLAQENTIAIANDEQSDTGANANITPHLHLLHDVRWFESVTIGNAQKESTLQVSAIGTFHLHTSDGIKNLHMYYSPNASNTIVSPTAICRQYPELMGFHQWSNVKTHEGQLKFVNHDNDSVFDITMTETNGLWYHSARPISSHEHLTAQSICVNALSDAAKFELWHQRLGHCGSWAMENAHKHVIGVPKLRGNSFYKCASCMNGKLCTKRSNVKRNRNLGTVFHATDDGFVHTGRPPDAPDPSPDLSPDLRDTTHINIANDKDIETYLDDLHLPNVNPGQHFHVDFGFVRGSEFKSVTEEGKTITSIDRKNSYLLIVDRKTRYMWIHNSDSKEPPLTALRQVLTKFGSNDRHRTIRSDQDQGLGKSKAYLAMLDDLNFTSELTGTDNSQQNSRAERPHRDLSQMMRCMLHSANLGPEYWTYALTQAVYIKNRIPHKSLNMTPFQAFTGRKPDLSRLRIFGSRVCSKRPGKRSAKLDLHTDNGVFLAHGATDANAYFLDDATATVKLGTHVIFDEAHMSVPARKAPLAAEALQRVGYYNREQWITDDIRDEFQADSNSIMRVQRLSDTAILPTRGTEASVGYDLCSDIEEYVLQPGQTHIFQTGIAAASPPGCYLRVAPRSGNTVKRHLNTLAGVIDPDYRGNIGVVLHNFGTCNQTIRRSDKIAQLIVERADTPAIMECDSLTHTSRGINGFGSTDKNTATAPIPSKLKEMPLPRPPSLTNAVPPPYAAAAAAVTFDNASRDLNLSLSLPFDIDLTNSPFDSFTDRKIRIAGTDDLLGFDMDDCTKFGYPKLLHCRKSTPSARLLRWKSELRNNFITHLNRIPVNSVNDIRQHIAKARSANEEDITVTFALLQPTPTHAETGLPQLFYDQMNVIGQHLYELNHDPSHTDKYSTIVGLDGVDHTDLSDTDKTILNDLRDIIAHKIDSKIDSTDLAKQRGKLSRKKLQQCSDWKDWEESERKQLDQYHDQDTFGDPQTLPSNSNVLNLLWTYLIKDCGRKKARCVCNGSKKMRGSVTLAETYAAALEQTGSRIFWAATALNNFVSIGADAANAFAEAPAPVAPLYVRVDEPFRQWYSNKFPHRPPIPRGHVMRVKKALQGHPESARLWAILIDNVIRDLNLQPCTHEPNLYFTTNYKDTGKRILFLRQVDDFAISCEDADLARDIISSINSKMTIDVKELGMIDRFNGVDITQTRNYIKLSNATYLKKIFRHHHWMLDEVPLSKRAVPMKDSTDYQRQLESSIPLTDQERDTLETKLGFTYRQAIGELIYALVTCRPDISFACIKLSQYSASPSLEHFEAVQHLYKYLAATIDDGITYWRQTPNMSLPFHPDPFVAEDKNYDSSAPERKQNDPYKVTSAVDSDYAGDNSHRKSVSGICIKLAGGTILYKSQYQSTIALSTTEAEFTAACEAGKYILYIRSIMQQIGMEQTDATILYEDNQGALLMANAQRPTKRTRHMDVKHFVLQQWVGQDLLNLKRINSADNYSDVLTKATGKILFRRHMDHIMGCIKPEYATMIG
jgi:deoxyuridine 5'-triphosphate nucleotidohydrolase